MKKQLVIPAMLLAFFSSMLIATRISGQGIEFVHDLDSALAIAKAQNKPVFVDFYTSWCAPCKEMTRNVFPQQKVGTYFNDKFINAKIQCDDNGKGEVVGRQYQVTAYPTLMFLNPSGEMIHSTAGSMSQDELIELASIAVDPQRNLASLVNQWNGGKRDTAFVRHYLTTLTSSYRTQLASNCFEEYFKSLPRKSKNDAFVFSMIRLLGYAPPSEMFRHLENNHKQFQSSVGKATIDNYISRGYESQLVNLALSKGLKSRNELDSAKRSLAKRKYPFADRILQYVRVFETFDTAGRVDIEEYQRRGTAFLEKYGVDYDGYTLSLAHLLANSTGKANAGTVAITWMEQLLARNPEASYYRTYFYVLWRNYQLEKAIKVGEEIRASAIRDKRPTKDIDNELTMVKGLLDKQRAQKPATN